MNKKRTRKQKTIENCIETETQTAVDRLQKLTTPIIGSIRRKLNTIFPIQCSPDHCDISSFVYIYFHFIHSFHFIHIFLN